MLKKMFKHMRKSTRGFSLAELMAVVVIIGVLVSIAIPVYNNTTERAEEAVCHANQRMIEGALVQYMMNENVSMDAAITAFGEDESELNDYFKGGIPKCPSGGTYGFDDDQNVTCTLDGTEKHSHYSEEAPAPDDD